MQRSLLVLLLFAAVPVQAQGKVTSKGVAINSAVFANKDAFVELRNHTADSVDMSGWSLGERKPGVQDTAWRFPAGTVLESGASVVIAIEPAAYFDLHHKKPDFETFDDDRGPDAEAIEDDPDVPNLVLVSGTGGDDRIGLKTAVGALQLRDAVGGLTMSLPYSADEQPMVETGEDPVEEARDPARPAAQPSPDSAAGSDRLAAPVSAPAELPGREGWPWPWIGLAAALLVGILMFGRRKTS
jgi:hypothetical protein